MSTMVYGGSYGDWALSGFPLAAVCANCPKGWWAIIQQPTALPLRCSTGLQICAFALSESANRPMQAITKTRGRMFTSDVRDG